MLEEVGIVFALRDDLVGLDDIGDVGGFEGPAFCCQQFFRDFSGLLVRLRFGNDDADRAVLTTVGRSQSAAGQCQSCDSDPAGDQGAAGRFLGTKKRHDGP